MSNPLGNDKGYFATLLGNDFTAECWRRVKEWDYYFYSSPIYKRMRTSARFYVGTDDEGFTSAQVGTRGTQNQLSNLKANHVRPVIQNVLSMTTAQRPGIKPIAKTTDASSQAQTLLASNRFDYYMTEQAVEMAIAEVAEMALVLSMGYLVGCWNQNAGNATMPNPLSPTGLQRDGDLEFHTCLPFDMIGDPTRHDTNHPWRIHRSYESKYELAAQHPDLADKIQVLQMEPDVARLRFDLSSDFRRERRMETDQIPVYEFFHKDCASVPGGRYAKFLAADLQLTVDPPEGWSPLPYDEIPIWELMPSKMFGTCWGYTNAFDMLGLQQGVDTLTSIPISNQKTLGIQALLMPAGHTFSLSRIVEGFPIIEYDSKVGKPESIQWTQTAPEIFQFRQQLISEMGTIGGGLTDVSRGMGANEKMSGAAMAMQDSLSLRFNGAFQRNFEAFIKKVAMFIIKTTQRYVVQPRQAQMSGGLNSGLVRDFTGKDLENIGTVTVETVNPMFKTTSGRLQVAGDLMDKGAISGKQYIGIIDTGKLEVATEAPELARINIKRENEDLAKGMPCVVSQTDIHMSHIPEHRAVLDSQEARSNPQVYHAVMDHIETHLYVWNMTPPPINQVIGNGPPPGPSMPGFMPDQGSLPSGMQAPPPPPAPMMGPGPGGGPPGPPPPHGAGPQNGAAAATMAPPGHQKPKGPNMPKNPETGQPYNPQNGGMS